VQTIKPSASEKKKVEVLGDRVRCDVRFTELGLPVSEYMHGKCCVLWLTQSQSNWLHHEMDRRS
jgi:hypothetical protein